jgi:uncharacterized protein YbaP (TraB family)
MKRLYCVVLLAFSALLATAQPPKSSLLWEISGNGLKTPSYLFGTFHMMCRSDFEISEILKTKLVAAKQFYGEISMEDLGDQMKLARQMMMTDKTISAMMSEDEFSKAAASFQQITGMPLQMFNNFKPFMALSMVTLNSIPCTDKIQPETEFAALAKENRLTLLGLETIEDQVKAINTQPLDSQVKQLKMILLNYDSVKNVMQQIIAVYKKRNIDSIYAFMKSGGEIDFENELIIKRNHNWIPLIEKAIADKPSFFAVGAGHLGGSEGVIALLRKRGYTLTPVKY